MPLPQNSSVFFGAGVFGIVCAATLYMVERYRHDRCQHEMVRNIVNVQQEVSLLRRELDSILAAQKQKHSSSRKKPKKRITDSTLSVDDDFSTIKDADSSDLEFYDLSDEENEITIKSLESSLDQIDKLSNEGVTPSLKSCIEILQNLCLEYPSNLELLWRLGRTHYFLHLRSKDGGEHLKKGIEACSAALNIDAECVSAHKYMAMLIGERTKTQPFKEKANDGMLMKKHIDEALKLDNTDPILHHMLGRFTFNVSDLKWYEKKIASALFEIPPGTFEDALASFQEAEKLSKTAWPENSLYIAKCQIKLNNIAEGLEILKKVDQANVDSSKSEIGLEIEELLKKYSE